MIIGRGLIANVFAGNFSLDKEVTIFASGVSNSNETNIDAFVRERSLLKKAIAQCSGTLVYFSTCSIEDHERKNTSYVQHKIEMESIIKKSRQYLIFRLPQIVGHTSNPFTLTNYLYTQILSGNRFPIWENAWRNIIDIDDVEKIASHIIRDTHYRNRIFNIASPTSCRVVDLVSVFERILGISANYEKVTRGDYYGIDVTDTINITKYINVEFDSSYIEKVIKKYYGNKHIEA